jgi:WD40 repeat protein
VEHAISPDGKWVVYGALGCSLELWDSSAQKLVRRFDEPVGWDDMIVDTIALNNSVVLVASGDGGLIHQIRAWDIGTGAVLATYPLSRGCFSLSNLSDDGRFICCTDDGEIHYLSIDNLPS